MADTTNLTWGIYRRIWTGFVHGRRINSISEAAECFFWRLHKPADDLGNFSADPAFLKSECAPRRNWSAARIEKLLAELAAVELIQLYEVEGERFGHIMEFLERQPLGYDEHRNKRKPIQRCPLWSFDAGERTTTNGYEEKRIVRPDKNKNTDKNTDTENESCVGFDRFWQAWPKHQRKTDKANCRKIWKTNKLEAIAGQIVLGVVRWAGSQAWADEGGKYIPLPATWLNKHRWEDEDLVPAGKPKKTLAELEREKEMAAQ